MPHPGEQFYPEGVRWDAPIAQGTLPDLLSQAAREYGDRTAIEFRDRPITYTALEQLAEVAASAFLRAGYGKDTSVALFLGNTPDHPANFFGALKAGARVVHLSPLDGEIALSHKLSDSGARVLVTSNLSALLPTALKFLAKGLLDRLIVCEDDNWGKIGTPQTALPGDARVITYKTFVDGATGPAQWPAISPNDIALLQYTGGTTGLPKGAMLSHLRHGYLISLHQRFDVESVMRDIEVKRATSFPGVPTMWIAIAALPDLDKRDFSSLRTAGSGGAPLPVEVAAIFERKVGMKLRSGWGMPETCPAGTAHPDNGPEKPGSVGVALPAIEMDVVSLDDPTKVLKDGETGEIRIRGPNVTRGYWNRPEETAQAFVGDSLLTGDIVYRDEEGYFFLVDRKKDMIISGGFNVYPQMIEQAIYTHPGVLEVIVIGISDDYRGEAAKAFITLRPGAQPFSLDELRAFLTGNLGKHELPAAVEFVKELPRTPVGKLSRHELRKVQPATATQQQVV